MDKKVLEFVNKLESWKTAIKNLHWSSKNMSQHKLCDDIADRIADFQDQVSEVEQGIHGKIALNKLKPTQYKITTLQKFVSDIIKSTMRFLKVLDKKGDEYIGMRSDCESFISDMQRNLYLVNFTLSESFRNYEIDRIVNENVDRTINEASNQVRLSESQFYKLLRESVKMSLNRLLKE